MKIIEIFKLMEDGFDIADDIFDYGVFFFASDVNVQKDDYYDQVQLFIARDLDIIKLDTEHYSICKISEFMDRHRKAFDKWMNNNYYEAYQPQNRVVATIDDEEFYDIYIELFNDIVCGNLSESNYKELYGYLMDEYSMYRLGLNETLRVINQSLRNGGYQVFTNNGNIYVADLSYGNVVHHRDGRITYKDCYLVKDEYITYDDVLDDYTLSDCGGKEYKVVIQEENLFGFAKIRKYRGVK